jgi:hypothetical protein
VNVCSLAPSISIADRAPPASISIADRRGRGSISIADHHDRPTVPSSSMVDGRWSMVARRSSMVGFSFPKCPVGNNSARLPDDQAKKVFLCGALDAK